jgi:hypothetical protein
MKPIIDSSKFPDTNLDCFEVFACVERQWTLRAAFLNAVHHQFLQAASSEDVHPEHLLIAAGILGWLASFERCTYHKRHKKPTLAVG